MPLCGPLAENWICPLSFTCGVVGEMVSFGVDTIVAVAWPDLLGAATEVAVMVTVAGEGTLRGAV